MPQLNTPGTKKANEKFPFLFLVPWEEPHSSQQRTNTYFIYNHPKTLFKWPILRQKLQSILYHSIDAPLPGLVKRITIVIIMQRANKIDLWGLICELILAEFKGEAAKKVASYKETEELT